MGVTAHISGLKELQAKLDALPTKLAKRVLRPALTDAAQIIQQAIGVAAPRATGHLTTNIVYEIVIHNDLSASVKVGPDQSAFYAIYAELGTSPHDETSKDGRTWRHPGQPARPFIRPAFALSVDEYIEALVTNINDGLADVSK